MSMESTTVAIDCKKEHLVSLGKALSLAIELKMSVHIGEGVSWVETQDGFFVSCEHKELGAEEATRKAIWSAASGMLVG